MFLNRLSNLDLNFILKEFNIQQTIPHLNRNPIYDKHPNLDSDKYYTQILSQEK